MVKLTITLQNFMKICVAKIYANPFTCDYRCQEKNIRMSRDRTPTIMIGFNADFL